ncbi:MULTISPECIES: hypothetical protein [Methylobacter]
MTRKNTKKFFTDLCDQNPDEAERLMQLMQQSTDAEALQPVDTETLDILKIKSRFSEETQRVNPAFEWHPAMQEVLRQYSFYMFEKNKNAPPVPPTAEELSKLKAQGADVHYIQTGERAFEPVATPAPEPFYITLEELIAYDRRIDSLQLKAKKT